MKPVLKEKLLHPSRNNKRAKFGDMSRFDTQQKPTKQLTDVLADVSDNDTLKMPFIAPNEKAQDASVASLLQVESHKQKSRHQLAHRRVYLMPASKEPIAYFDKEPVLVVNHRAIEGQLDMFISEIAEDIASRTTMQLPVIVLPREQQMQTDQHQVITNAAGGAAIAGAGDLISAVLRYATNVFMTNIVTQGIYGTYVAVYTVAILVGYIAPLGMDSAISRFLPTHRAKGELDLAAGLIRFVVWMTLILGLLCGILLYLAAPALAHLVYHQDAYVLPLREAVVLVPLTALITIFSCGLQSLKAVKWKVYVDRLLQPGLTLVLTGVLYLLGLRLEALIFATIGGLLAAVVTGQVLMHKASKHLNRPTVPRYEAKNWLRFALPMSFNSMILNILSSTDVLFLSAFATSAQVGLYAAPDRASLIVTMPLLALNIIFSPLIAEHYALGQRAQLASMARVITKWSFSLSLPIFLCFCVFHEAILSIFSKGYTAAGLVLIILSFGNLVDAGVGSVWNILAMTGHARVILVNTVLTIVVNIGLAFLLVPRYNVIGAAVASALAVILLNIAGFIEVYCMLKILTLRWDMLKPVVAGGVASLAGIFLLRIVHVGYGFQAVFGVLGLVIPFLVVYVCALSLLRFNKEEMMVLNALRAKFGKKHVV